MLVLAVKNISDAKPKKKEKKAKKEGFSFSKLIKGLSNDSMFNDNDA